MSVPGVGGCCSSFWSWFCCGCPCCGCVCCCCGSVDVLGKNGTGVDPGRLLGDASPAAKGGSSPAASTDPMQISGDALNNMANPSPRSRASSAEELGGTVLSLQRQSVYTSLNEGADRKGLMASTGSAESAADHPEPLSPTVAERLMKEAQAKDKDTNSQGSSSTNSPAVGFPPQRPITYTVTDTRTRSGSA